MSITTGEFLTCALLGLCPTALGRALDSLPDDPKGWTTQAWGAALKADIANRVTMEEPLVVSKLLSHLEANQFIFQQLLTPVYLPVSDAPGQFYAVPLARVVREQFTAVGKEPNLLNVPWPSPPHPCGAFLAKLMTTLIPYDEK